MVAKVVSKNADGTKNTIPQSNIAVMYGIGQINDYGDTPTDFTPENIQSQIEQILKDYIAVDAPFFYHAMEKISPYIKKSAKDEAINAYEKGDLRDVAAILLVEYYDKVYKKPLKIDASFHNTELSQTVHLLSSLNP